MSNMQLTHMHTHTFLFQDGFFRSSRLSNFNLFLENKIFSNVLRFDVSVVKNIILTAAIKFRSLYISIILSSYFVSVNNLQHIVVMRNFLVVVRSFFARLLIFL
jgi:hypothetical protein